MRIEKKLINDCDVYVYNTKKYSSIHLTFLFQMPFTRENIFKCDLLEEYMLYTNKMYKNRDALGDKRMELYSMDFGLSNHIRGEFQFTKINFAFYDPELVKDDYLEDALKFVRELLFCPNFEDGKLDAKIKEQVITNLLGSMGDDLVSARGKRSRSFLKALYPNTYKTRDMIESKEEYEKILRSFTDSDIIDMYNRLVHESLVGAVLMGNIKPNYYRYLEKVFKFKKHGVLNRKFKDKIKINTKTPFKTVYEDETIKDSNLSVVYSCPSRSFRERMVYSVISRMLSSSGMIIHKTLRDEMNLVYGAGTSYNARLDYMVLGANLDYKNEEAAMEGFSIALKKLEDKDTVSKLLVKIKDEDSDYLYCFDENKFNNYGELFDRAFKLDASELKKLKVVKTIETDEVIAALKNMKIVKIHFYKGVKE